jgi:hypothetical protein
MVSPPSILLLRHSVVEVLRFEAVTRLRALTYFQLLLPDTATGSSRPLNFPRIAAFRLTVFLFIFDRANHLPAGNTGIFSTASRALSFFVLRQDVAAIDILQPKSITCARKRPSARIVPDGVIFAYLVFG